MSEIRYSLSPEAFKKYTTEDIRKEFLIPEVLQNGKITAVYSLYDRMVTMGAVPTNEAIDLPVYEELTKAEYFLQRREMGIINVGGSGKVTVDGEVYELANKECLYIGRGAKNVTFASNYAESPAQYFINSSPAHKEYPTTKATLADANEVNLGSKENCNERTIYQFIHEGGIQSCQLVMGFTTLKTGSIWNTFPPHTHLRRMEVYFYFDLPEDQIVMHFMGDPQETRHIAVHNHQAVISPEWSIHSGAGTAAYSFIWAMAGENQAFTDMDGQELKNIR
ncbi:MAG: 5-dehydro-4-deoxy-D-glucuronate isomerase [Flammeovirgaceae bacterium]|nr:5-dehydro-4-deoxy-D-glucuronate isomerase [Flammeovirgaceae bacterium]MBE60728.1 5-dehydro-4-deoxy-D-glucuronate isomerase [Flammeovirgaceae bacterium]HCX21228.1 5-dehydro-4-deoxy-D-glucuronate isomerase [Cytophagales bacterium]|tara:strand:- start:5945 stop:6781 length:837 start_codon:yes stop_codon:yes gene_type:complete